VQKNLMKYPRVGERWILESLMPWEQFGIWHEHAFGPKPPDGEYVLSHIFQLDLVKMMQAPADERTQYISLDDFGQDNLRLLLHCIEKSKALQAWQLRRFEEEMLASEEKDFHEQFENVYDDTCRRAAQDREAGGRLAHSDLARSPAPRDRSRAPQKRPAAGQSHR
jgi:hypothetical protein